LFELKVVNSAGINARRVRHGSTAPCSDKESTVKSALKKFTLLFSHSCLDNYLQNCLDNYLLGK